MNPTRLALVFRVELVQYLRRPLVWILLVLLALLAFGLSSGVVRIASGDSRIGGTKAWITSEFALAQILTIVDFLHFPFFIAVLAGMAVIRDDEQKIGELLHATPLTAGEYIWGKFLAALVCFLAVLAVQLAATMACFHFNPGAETREIRGPFDLTNYLRPTLVLVVPMLLFVLGVSFAVGERTRQPILLFVLPVALVLACGFFLWQWSPNWLDPGINRVLMLVDPSGFRWVNETYLKDDRGVVFYNTAPMEFDWGFLASRIVLAAAGLLAVALAHRHFAATLRGIKKADRRWGGILPAESSREPEPVPVGGPPLKALAMRSGAPGLLRGIRLVAAAELRELRSQPGLYLWAPLIVAQVVGTGLVAVGAFDTPLLATPGTLAVATMNTLTLLICLLLTFYTVESLQREPTTGLASIHYATPVRTAAVLFGKALANSLVGGVILLAALVAAVIVLLVQGRVSIQLWPFGLVWGLLLVPTFIGWTAFVTAVLAVTGNRYTAYGISLAALVFTGYRQFTDRMNWVGNWMLWDAVRWSDMGVFELDRTALILNRVMVLGLAVFFTAVAVRTFRRRDLDPGRVVQRFYPLALLKTGWRLLPYAVVPVAAGFALWLQVYQGFEGDLAKKAAKDYWRANLATWKDHPLPALTAVDLDLELEPARRWFRIRGTYDLVNHRKDPIRQVPVTGGAHWDNVSWTVNGADYQPEARTHLSIFTPSTPLQTGDRLKIGFAYEGTFPRGITANGGGTGEFILPGGVVLTSFSTSFVPMLGYQEGVGVDKDNRYESREYPDDFYKGLTDPMIGSPTAFTTAIRITAPEEYVVHSVGTRERETQADGRRTVEWRSDYPVRFFNVVAGRWSLRQGDGTLIAYHPDHAYNIDEMIAALDASRRWYSEWFYPFPWRELKLSEFPNLATYAQGFATNITFSEGIGFLARHDPRAEAAFVITAHEAAHQWWGNLVVPGKGPGGNILAEGMAHFSTMLLAEQVNGPRSRIEFCKRLEEKYGEDRQADSERPLVKIDGDRPGDTTVTYDKGGWVFWMLLRHLGREQALKGLRLFVEEYRAGPDFPVLQDFVALMRRVAPDSAAYDAFVKQWFFEVVVPEYRLSAQREAVAASGEAWEVRVRVENAGTGRMPVDVAAVSGERFTEDGKVSPDYREARVEVVLGAGESKHVTIRCDFKPERLVIDPDAGVLQLKRKAAVIRF